MMSVNCFAVNTVTRKAVFIGRSSWLEGISEVAPDAIDGFVRSRIAQKKYAYPESLVAPFIAALIDLRPDVTVMDGYDDEYWFHTDCVCVAGIEPDAWYIGRTLAGKKV
jgi:hypothetical protein